MPQSPSSSNSANIRLIVAASVLLAITWFSRCEHLTDSLWIDELHTAWSLDGEFSEIADRAASGNQPPLYFWINRLITSDGAADPVKIRLLSFLMTWLTATVLFAVIAKVSSRSLMAFIWAALYLMDRRVFVFSVEARPYATLQFVALLHIWCFLLLMSPRGAKQKRLLVIAWVITGVLMCQLHYTSLLLIPAEWFGWLLFNGMKHQLAQTTSQSLNLKTLAVATLAMGVACLISSGHILEILSKREMWSQFVSVKSLRYTLLSMPVIPVLITLAVSTRLFIAKATDPAHDKWVQAFARILTGVIGFVFVVAWVATATGWMPIFFARYLVSILPLVYLAGGLAISRSGVQPVVCTVATLLVLMFSNQLVWDWQGQVLETHKREHWPEAMLVINELAPEADEIYLAASLIEDHDLVSNPGLLLAGGHTLQEFCGFPIRCQSDDELMGRRVIAVPSHRPALLPSQIAEITSDKLMVLVARGSTATGKWQTQLQNLLGANWRVQLYSGKRMGSINIIIARHFR
ncbi:MAG: hypothetical protein ACJZ8O_07660 [Pirellulaceae bacterium]